MESPFHHHFLFFEQKNVKQPRQFLLFIRQTKYNRKSLPKMARISSTQRKEFIRKQFPKSKSFSNLFSRIIFCFFRLSFCLPGQLQTSVIARVGNYNTTFTALVPIQEAKKPKINGNQRKKSLTKKLRAYFRNACIRQNRKMVNIQVKISSTTL